MRRLTYAMGRAGGSVGMAVGSFVGTMVEPGFGTIAGAMTGWTLGSAGGAALGKKVGDVIFGVPQNEQGGQQTQNREALIPTERDEKRKESWQKTENTIHSHRRRVGNVFGRPLLG
ncbi:MAG: hypothetical protein WDW20_01420 [Neisseriaceae bacterium]